MPKQIKDFLNKSILSENDLLLVQDSIDNSYKNCTKKQLLAGISGGGSGMSPWKFITADYLPNNGDRLVIDTSVNAVNLALADDASFGAEIEIIRLESLNDLKIGGITKINGFVVTTNSVIYINPTLNSSLKLIYINANEGWLAIPSSNITFYKPLNLPTAGLIQKFYIGDISAPIDGQLINQWKDTVSAKHANQSVVGNQPTYKVNIFGNFGGLLFSGNQFFSVDFTHLANTAYTIALVERRTSGDLYLYCVGNDGQQTDQGLHVGYRNTNSFTFAQYGNDLDTSVPTFSTLVNRVWVVSKQIRGTEIWLNGKLVNSNVNNTLLSACNGGVIGRALIQYWYRGYLGLVATWTGAKSQAEIQDIFAVINNTFQIY